MAHPLHTYIHSLIKMGAAYLRKHDITIHLDLHKFYMLKKADSGILAKTQLLGKKYSSAQQHSDH
jgi:hypothetical protein